MVKDLFSWSGYTRRSKAEQAYCDMTHSYVFDEIQLMVREYQELQNVMPENFSEILQDYRNALTNCYEQLDLEAVLVESKDLIGSIEMAELKVATAEVKIAKPIIESIDELKKTSLLLEAFEAAGQLPELNKLLDDYKAILDEFDSSWSVGSILNSDGTITRGDKTYTSQELIEELNYEVNQVENAPTLKARLKKIKEKCWLILLIIRLLAFVPDACEALDFYLDHISNMISVYTGDCHYKHVIKERAFLREECNSKSDVLVEMLYSEQVEIIDEQPYWYKVKYVYEDKEIIGWVSKISVGTEDDVDK